MRLFCGLNLLGVYMSVKQKDIKILWGKSGGVCSFPDCDEKLTYEDKSDEIRITTGEIAHIIARSEGGPRGESDLNEEERDSYSNLILLCSKHHKLIDEAPEKYSVEKLHQFKRNHELWVEESLSDVDQFKKDQKEAIDIIYADIIDITINLLMFHDLNNWAYSALSPIPKWPIDLVLNFDYYRDAVKAVLWPGEYLELETSIKLLSINVKELSELISENTMPKSGYFIAIKKYKNYHNNTNRYEEEVSNYEDWIRRCYQKVYEIVRLANWFAEEVRKEINPKFLVSKGKFTVPDIFGELEVDEFIAPEFTDEEKDKLVKEKYKNTE